jgi:hypothetical protein
MLAATFLDRTVFMRELLPEDLKLEVDKISREEAGGGELRSRPLNNRHNH